jgi:hypothetical protein
VVCLAPRASGDSVRPRRLAGVVARPLNFTVRAHMNASVVLGKAALRVLAAVVIALVAFPLAVLAFHPWEGPIDGYSRATQPERYFALAFSAVVLVATLWRLFRGSTVREEISRAMDSLFSSSPHE